MVEPELGPRKIAVLRAVVDEYVHSGEPVGSETIVERAGLAVSRRAIRNELAALEELGFLTHPHTSAGRIPTDAGYRRYVDSLLDAGPMPVESRLGMQLSQLRREVDEAMRETTQALARVTDLVAMATAPSPSAATATIHRVEV